MVNLMRDGLLFNTVYDLTNLEALLVPKRIREASSHSLRALSLTTSGTNDFCYGHLDICQNIRDFLGGLRKITIKNGACVGFKPTLKTPVKKILEYHLQRITELLTIANKDGTTRGNEIQPNLLGIHLSQSTLRSAQR